MRTDIHDILEQLVAFPTVSWQSNLDLLDYVERLLRPAGVRLERFASADGTRANLWASLGPIGSGGVVLSGHSDVVPVTGQDWSTAPFELRVAEGMLYGRGTADMKGFIAVAIHTMLKAANRTLAQPLHLAISYDEEIGCLGVRSMLDALGDRPDRPALCLVGEPTGMRIATGHKGKRALRACCHGRSGHSALAPEALNALHLGADFITRLRERQESLRVSGASDADYEVPYSTIHAGVMQGGTVLNIVPDRCEIELEIRHLAADDPETLVAGITEDAEAVVAPHRNRFPEARIEIEEVSGYPGLEIPADAAAVSLLASLLDEDNGSIKVSFGTEGGLFHDLLGCPTLICGPGHMAQGHKPDEFVSATQLAVCAVFLDKIVTLLEHGDVPMQP